MIVDFHTHIFTDALAQRAKEQLTQNGDGPYKPYFDVTHAALLSRMDEVGIDISVVQPVATKRTQVENIIAWEDSILSKRIAGFAPMFPNAEDWKYQIDLIVSHDYKGIKLHPEYQHFVLDDDRMLRIYDYAFNKGLCILFHAGFDPFAGEKLNSSPKQFAHVMDELGGGTIIAAHLGGIKQWDEVESYLVGRDIFLDTSMGFKYYPLEQFMRILKTHGADRILFASDYPWSDAKEELEILNSLDISHTEKEKILYKNALKLIGREI